MSRTSYHLRRLTFVGSTPYGLSQASTINFSEICTDSLNYDLGPNWTCPYLCALAEWIEYKLDLAAILFFNFLNKASSLRTRFFRCFLSIFSSLSLLELSVSLPSTSTLPLSTPAFWTRAHSDTRHSWHLIRNCSIWPSPWNFECSYCWLRVPRF